jgi:MoaA/NifB/PqqE/SkfB family radical SAM enzyme
MGETTDYVHLFDDAIRVLFADAVHIALRHPSTGLFFVCMRRAQRRAERRRAQRRAERRRAAQARQGVHVPPFMIISVTGRCNLSCAGCYAQAQSRQEEVDMAQPELLDLVQQGRELGTGIMLLAGGEPLTRADDLTAIAQAVPDVIFPVFTNGMLLDDQLVKRLRVQRNLVPVVSLEGYAAETDVRRGQGVAGKAREAIARMRAAGMFFGTSLTVTRLNIDTVTDERYLRSLMGLGCRLFFFVEYVPVREGTEGLVLEGAQREQLTAAAAKAQQHLPGLFIVFPGDEDAYGGCLAAGRGFVHISPAGRLEPCPFAPYSDVNVRDVSLRDALGSPLLAAIRAGHDKLSETSGGCALWTQREWVSSLLDDEKKVADTKSSTI